MEFPIKRGIRILVLLVLAGGILWVARNPPGGSGADPDQVAGVLAKDGKFISRFGPGAEIVWDPSSRSVFTPTGGGDVTGYYNYRIRGKGGASRVKVYWGSNGTIYLRGWSE